MTRVFHLKLAKIVANYYGSPSPILRHTLRESLLHTADFIYARITSFNASFLVHLCEVYTYKQVKI